MRLWDDQLGALPQANHYLAQPGRRYFENDFGGKYKDAYFTLLARFEYDNRCYLSNPYAHFKAIIKERGIIDVDIYKRSNKGCISEDAKALKQEQFKNFDIAEDKHEQVLEILKVPIEHADEYKEYFLDSNKLSKHWNVCNFFFKDTMKVFDDYDKKTKEFNVKKIKNGKAKCKSRLTLKVITQVESDHWLLPTNLHNRCE